MIKKITTLYGRFIAKHPFIVLILILIVTALAINQATYIEIESLKYEDMLSKDLEVVQTLDLVKEKFHGVSTMQIVIETDAKYANSNEIRDIRDPKVLTYIDLLTQTLHLNKDILDVMSASDIIKQMNNNRIPKSIDLIKEQVENNQMLKTYIGKDYSITLVKIRLTEEVDEVEIEKELRKLIKEIPRPAGLKVDLIGEKAELTVMKKLVVPDMNKTSKYALIGILLIIILLFRSIKYGLIPLTTIIFGIIWAFGIMGLMRFNLTAQLAGVISMIMGIGIDFGIQIVTRFREELKESSPKISLINTINVVFVPMSITTFAALIGFKALSLGKLTIMADLGMVMSLGVLACMLAAISVVPSLLIIGENFKNKINGGTKK